MEGSAVILKLLHWKFNIGPDNGRKRYFCNPLTRSASLHVASGVQTYPNADLTRTRWHSTPRNSSTKSWISLTRPKQLMFWQQKHTEATWRLASLIYIYIYMCCFVLFDFYSPWPESGPGPRYIFYLFLCCFSGTRPDTKSAHGGPCRGLWWVGGASPPPLPQHLSFVGGRHAEACGGRLHPHPLHFVVGGNCPPPPPHTHFTRRRSPLKLPHPTPSPSEPLGTRTDNLRKFVLTHVILASGARGRVVPSRGSWHLNGGIRRIRWIRGWIPNRANSCFFTVLGDSGDAPAWFCLTFSWTYNLKH